MTKKKDDALDEVRLICMERGINSNKILRRDNIIDVYIGDASDFDDVPTQVVGGVRVMVRVCVPAKR